MNTFCGSPRYSSPECLIHEPYGGRRSQNLSGEFHNYIPTRKRSLSPLVSSNLIKAQNQSTRKRSGALIAHKSNENLGHKVLYTSKSPPTPIAIHYRRLRINSYAETLINKKILSFYKCLYRKLCA